ncbi:hypothetical protein HMPREF3066_06130 [Neisseria sp. HMSC03D10]|nr:hypothetical protein HMPREF3066_06130 [Neisseria sp. HMSC03D10]
MMYSIKILRVFSNHREKQPALRFLKVQAASDKERPSENYFSDGFEITGNMRILLGYDPSCVCCRLDYGMVWNHSVTTKNACVRTAHTLHLNLKVCVARSGRECGVATHAAGMDAGYGLLPRLPYLSANSPLMMAEVGTCMMVLLVSGWTVGGF